MKTIMKMKISIATLLVICLGSFSYGQISIAPEIGANMSSYVSNHKVGNTTSSYNSEYLLGVRAGVVLDFGITDFLFIQPAVYYNMARTKEEYYFLGKNTVTMTVQSLQIPAYLMFKTGPTDGGNFFVGIGPVLDWNFAGKIHTETELFNTSSKRDMKFGKDGDNNHDMRSIELGASATLGFQLEFGMYIRAYYNLGLSNLSPKGSFDEDTRRSRSFGLSFGYFL